MSDGISLAASSELFKINYDKKSENMYNSDNVLQGRINKKYDFTGKLELGSPTNLWLTQCHIVAMRAHRV